MAVPKTYEDLLKPEYKGLITMPNPASSGTGFLTVSGLAQLLGADKAWEYMDKLHENIGIYTHSGSKRQKWLVLANIQSGSPSDTAVLKKKRRIAS